MSTTDTSIATNREGTAAECYLRLLKSRGIDYLFVGSGTDTAPIVEAYARCDDAAVRYPTPIVVAHENAAIGMAHGFYMATGRPQAAMFHVSVGAGNAVCGLMNAARSQVPIFFTAGRTPLFESGELGARDAYIHWAQEMFDQGAMVRELVKWDYELRDGRNLPDVVDRALSIAMAHPRGPVYLTLPREVLVRPVTAFDIPPVSPLPAAPRADQASVRLLAQRIAAAEFPAISCCMTGINERCRDLLVALSDRFGVAINENKPRYAHFPTEHALHAGYDIDAVAEQADVLLFLDCDVPWIPGVACPRNDCYIAHAGTDPLYSQYPMRSFRSDLTIMADSASLLEDLVVALDAAGAGKGTATRTARIATHCRSLREGARARRSADGERAGPISKIFLSRCIDEVLDDDTVLVNEYSLIREQLRVGKPGQFFNFPPAGGLGWGVPAALGVKLALPEKTVVCVVGDGAFIFANPTACHHAAAMHGLPILTVVFNNGGWDAVQRATTALYPRPVGGSNSLMPLASLGPVPAFEKYSEASGGFGERVEDRSELPGAIRRALTAVRDGRQALLNVIGR